MAAGGIIFIMFYTAVRQSFHSNGRPPELPWKRGESAVSEVLAVVSILPFVICSMVVVTIPLAVYFSALVLHRLFLSHVLEDEP